MKPPRKDLTKAMQRRVFLEAEARCPWCEEGRKLKSAEAEIHHIDGDRSNNVFENLILTCRNHHGQIESQVIPPWEVELQKKCLSNPATMERLGLKRVESKPPPRKSRKKAPVVAGNNSGVTAREIHNHGGIIAGTVKLDGVKRGPILVANSLATSSDHYGYVEYLVKKLSKYRSWKPPKSRGKAIPDNPGAVRNNFNSYFGRLPKDFPLDRFNEAVEYFFEKTANTALGRIGKAKLSTFEEWKAKGKK